LPGDPDIYTTKRGLFSSTFPFSLSLSHATFPFSKLFYCVCLMFLSLAPRLFFFSFAPKIDPTRVADAPDHALFPSGGRRFQAGVPFRDFLVESGGPASFAPLREPFFFFPTPGSRPSPGSNYQRGYGFLHLSISLKPWPPSAVSPFNSSTDLSVPLFDINLAWPLCHAASHASSTCDS